MKEVLNKTGYSTEARRAREKDLKTKFGSDVEIYEPKNATIARLNDLATKVIDYKKQLVNIKTSEEETIIRGRVAGAMSQILDIV
jgi:hypothetical protein